MEQKKEQIPYACGRLAELEQGIRWRCEQLSFVHKEGGQQYLNQTAKLLQGIINSLQEAALLLEELDIPKVSAYTTQLCAALQMFHIQTPDYSKLLMSLNEWMEYISPLLPDKETHTVTAAVVGRMMNSVRMGYYPTDDLHVEYLKKALVFPEKIVVNILDPCCGEGKALQQLADGSRSATYGAEIDASRAEEAQARLDHVAIGSYYYARISRSVFHVLFLNPPYLQLHGCARSEKRFLGESYDHLMMGGVLIYIIPYYRLTSDICTFLAAHFDHLMAYRFCKEEFAKFRQIAILGTRKPYAENQRLARLLEAVSLAPDKLPTVDQITPGSYLVPEIYRQVPQFYGEKFNVRELAQQMQRMGSMLPKRSVLDEYGQKKHPPLPLTIGQIGLVGGSGLINGLIECETPHIIKGQVIKSKSSRTGATIEEPDGSTMTEVVETVSNKMIFNLLTSEGIKTLI